VGQSQEAVHHSRRAGGARVDDWAQWLGIINGTILVDLERHRVIDLLQ
jgi:hypothetical protein